MWLRSYPLPPLTHSLSVSCVQSLADQETLFKLKLKELEANVLAAAPDKAKQKQMEKSLEGFKKGRDLPRAADDTQDPF